MLLTFPASRRSQTHLWLSCLCGWTHRDARTQSRQHLQQQKQLLSEGNDIFTEVSKKGLFLREKTIWNTCKINTIQSMHASSWMNTLYCLSSTLNLIIIWYILHWCALDLCFWWGVFLSLPPPPPPFDNNIGAYYLKHSSLLSNLIVLLPGRNKCHYIIRADWKVSEWRNGCTKKEKRNLSGNVDTDRNDSCIHAQVTTICRYMATSKSKRQPCASHP